MDSAEKGSCSDFEKNIKLYLRQGRQKLDSDLAGTREAIRLIADDKTRDFLRVMDKGLDRDERKFLSELIVASMYQSFCFGYGIGMMEGHSNTRIVL